MISDLIRQLNAAKTFKINDDFKVIGFEDVTSEDFDEGQPLPDILEIWSAVKINYNGELPESYKTLNLMIGDWVTAHEEALSVEVHSQLKEHFTKNYPESDISSLDDLENSAIWLDQLDYMPVINEDEKSLVIEVELILHAESIE